MKLVKFIPAIAATLVLSACSSAEKVADTAAVVNETAVSTVETVTSSAEKAVETVNAVANPGAVKNTSVKTSSQKLNTEAKSVAYQCLNKVKVSATYAFDGETPKAVNLLVGKKAINGLVFDIADKDSVTFKNAKYEWSLDNSFYTDMHKAGAMLTQKGKTTDQILAKLCDVNLKATEKLNKQ